MSPRQEEFPGPSEPDRLTDAELDSYIRTRFALIGVDLEVLPERDPAAPTDRVRVFRSLRTFLRNTVPALSAFELDPQRWPPMLYPSALPPVGEESPREG